MYSELPINTRNTFHLKNILSSIKKGTLYLPLHLSQGCVSRQTLSQSTPTLLNLIPSMKLLRQIGRCNKSFRSTERRRRRRRRRRGNVMTTLSIIFHNEDGDAPENKRERARGNNQDETFPLQRNISRFFLHSPNTAAASDNCEDRNKQ